MRASQPIVKQALGLSSPAGMDDLAGTDMSRNRNY
jgi:hypothetical protein